MLVFRKQIKALGNVFLMRFVNSLYKEMQPKGCTLAFVEKYVSVAEEFKIISEENVAKFVSLMFENEVKLEGNNLLISILKSTKSENQKIAAFSLAVTLRKSKLIDITDQLNDK